MKKRKPFSLTEKILIVSVVVVVFAVSVAASVYVYSNRNNTMAGTKVSSPEATKGKVESALYDYTINTDQRIAELEKLVDEGKFEEAEKAAEEILKTNPSNDTKVDALWELAIAESAQSKFREAIEHGKSIEEIDAASSHFILGIIYTNMKDYTSAKEEFTKAKKENPKLKNDIDGYLQYIESIQGSTK